MTYLHSLINCLSAHIDAVLLPYFPTRCFLCNDKCTQKKILCQDCVRNLPFLSATCELCATTLTASVERLCGACLISPPAYDRLITLFEYHYPINSFIIRLKFHQQLRYARLLGELFADTLQKYYQHRPLPECIIPVPLHADRLKERGFNQSTEIAKPIAKILGVPIVHHVAYRTKSTLSQSKLPKKIRKQNIQAAFLVRNQPPFQHIALLDDVTTTGQTLQELSKTLKAAGVITIDSWCIAKRMLDYKA